MGDPSTCKHNGMHWFAAPANEQGWRCVDCEFRPGEPPGFSPRHDRELITTKVGGIIHDLHDAEFIYVSNGCEGDQLTAKVAHRCRASGIYDSVSIARFVLEIEGDDQHATFWRDISDGILAGKDPRDRCACGQLSNMVTFTGGRRFYACSYEHMQKAMGRNPREPF